MHLVSRSKGTKRGSVRRGSSAHARSIKLGSCVLRFDEPRVMGIVNNTPDSFSGDGTGGDSTLATEKGIAAFKQGADIVDVGGESTRPGAHAVSIDIEIDRTVPVIERLAALYPGRVSIDTRKPEVAKAALFAGATIVNDVSGLRDRRMIDVVAEHDAAVIIMHMLGDPQTMQRNPRYENVVRNVGEYLSDRIEAAERGGVTPRKIMIDPGIGFGKTLRHNLQILSMLQEFSALGKPLVVGVSRKSFIGKLTGKPVEERLAGSLAAAVLAVAHGADMLRVHDVTETVDAIKVARAIITASTRTD